MAGSSKGSLHDVSALQRALLLVKQPDNVQLQLELAYQPEA